MAISDAPAGTGELLRFITCGSVDDGKSTLIGRLLLDADAVPEDHLHANGIDGELAQLVDGLHAERAQGITIDVGYRYFTTGRRRFVIADTPGHEQYTRNMATGASTADLAVILVDAAKGMRRQTYRHSAIVAMMGIRQVVLAINKMDLVGWRPEAFAAIAATYRALTAPLALPTITAIPMSARLGDNVFEPGRHMPWYDGPTLLEHLEAVDVAPPRAKPFRFAVQWVTRHEPSDFRGYAGTVLGGDIRPGDEIVVLPSGQRSRIARIVTKDGDLAEATNGQAVTLTLADDIDVARGDLLASTDDRPPELADQLAAHLLWLDEAPMLPGRPYLMRLGPATVTATVSELKHQLDMDDGTHKAAKQLAANEIGFANLALDRPMPFDAYDDNRDTGGFILIDRLTSATVGAGMIRFPLRRAANLKWHDFTVDRAQRSAIKRHRPAILWFTGLSGAGKSTIADGVEQRLLALGHHTYTLDGDNVRHGLNRDLGFTDADRVENIRRVIETANLMADAGLIVLISFISPFRAERARARERLAGSFFFAEIFVDTPLAECERRDPKGLYRKARSGDLQNFTGLDSPYEAPDRPDLHLRTTESTIEAEIDLVVDILRDNGVLGHAGIGRRISSPP